MSRQKVNVVGNRASLKKCAFEVLQNSAHVGVEFIPNLVRQHRLAVLRREHDVNEDLGERLRHEVTPFQG